MVYEWAVGLSVSVSNVGVDVDSGLVWGVLVLLFLSSCSFSSFCFCNSPSQSSTSSCTLFCSLVSFSSYSESEQSDLRGMGHSVGHCFLTGVHVTQYPGYFWVWLDKVTDGWVGTYGTMIAHVNVKDAPAY